MGLSNTTIIVCDLRGKKPCHKKFLLPDDPKLNTPGVEHTVSSKDAMGNTLFFCCPLHMVAHWVEWIKATPQAKEELAAPPPNIVPFNGKTRQAPTLSEMQAAGIVQLDLEEEPPQALDDLNLDDPQ